MAIINYYIDGFWWLMVVILLMTISAYSINDYWLLFY
jgi:hypothetical protein